MICGVLRSFKDDFIRKYQLSKRTKKCLKMGDITSSERVYAIARVGCLATIYWHKLLSFTNVPFNLNYQFVSYFDRNCFLDSIIIL